MQIFLFSFPWYNISYEPMIYLMKRRHRVGVKQLQAVLFIEVIDTLSVVHLSFLAGEIWDTFIRGTRSWGMRLVDKERERNAEQ